MSAIASVLLLAVAGVAITKLFDLNRMSDEKNVIRNRDVPNFVQEPDDELFNPMNTGSFFNKVAPICSVDEGPFGLTRIGRKSNTDTTFYSWGSVLDDY